MQSMIAIFAVTVLLLCSSTTTFAFRNSNRNSRIHTRSSFSSSSLSVSPTDIPLKNDRRAFLDSLLIKYVGSTSAALVIASFPGTSSAMTTGIDGNLPDLPNDAVRSYLQYRIPLKIAADYYIFSLQGMISDVDQWGDVSQLFSVNNNKGQGQPSKIERDFVNPMRILLLSFPPDTAEEMRDAQFKFEKAMNTISKATAGYRRDLPVEIDSKSITLANKGWEEGRIALNEFFGLLNGAVGLNNELTSIPPRGPNQTNEYRRSPRRYNELQKKIKLCQNRGGPALSQAWGQLMVSGYLQDSCGIPDLNDYFNQEL